MYSKYVFVDKLYEESIDIETYSISQSNNSSRVKEFVACQLGSPLGKLSFDVIYTTGSSGCSDRFRRYSKTEIKTVARPTKRSRQILSLNYDAMSYIFSLI
jgi:predicted nucleic acid binding AN1-type Zn finger protein